MNSDPRDARVSNSDEASDKPVGAKYVIGIDSGTTNSALCWIDSASADGVVHTFTIPQIVNPGQVERLETLPSFHYEGTAEDVRSGAFRLPWQSESPACVTGVFARDQGRSVPGRMVESAKSWLCHHGVDRRAAILPWHGATDVQRLSPVDAISRYLRHLREEWNAEHAEHPMEQQDVILTIPASFDEVARELTVMAARAAGLPRVILLEEPQAAFYSWVHFHQQSWEQIVAPGQKILVCDIGGGTSDFSLIHVRSGESGRLQFHRVAVGEHLLLGGDNLDLAIAHAVEAQLAGRVQLDARQWSMLVPACRHAKETLLGSNAPETLTVNISGSGSRLIGGSLQAELRREDVLRMVIEGFLPDVTLDDRPQRRQSGFQEFGLPYAADPAISRYLATFLKAHSGLDDPDTDIAPNPLRARPDIVLFNGGFFESAVLRQRMITILETLFRPWDPEWTPAVLRNDRLDLAVAQGAASYGMVRRGHGVRIVAGLARTYYIGIEQPDGARAALCLVAAGTEVTGTPITMDRIFQVRTSEPVEFPILVSGTRLTDQPGAIVVIDPEQLSSLPSIRTVLTSRKRGEVSVVDVRLSARLTEIGTLELWCEQVDGSRRWQLQFDVRAATETDREGHQGTAERSGIVDQATIHAAAEVLRSVFGPAGSMKPDETTGRLTAALGLTRGDWPPSLLRAIWAELMELSDGRRKSAVHEARWLNLVGYCLRPGLGMAADDWRVEETWRALGGRLMHGEPACLAELRTLCRRIAGGFSAGRQTQIAALVLPAIRQRFRQARTGRGKAAPYASGNHEAAEIWRMLGSLELLDQTLRRELGEMALDLMVRASFEPVRNALTWMLGRVGARVPVYGPLNLVLPVSVVTDWVESLLKAADLKDGTVQLTLMQLCRKTGDRFRDPDAALRRRVIERMRLAGAKESLLQLIEFGGELDQEAAAMIVGETLPAGLRLLQPV